MRGVRPACERTLSAGSRNTERSRDGALVFALALTACLALVTPPTPAHPLLDMASEDAVQTDTSLTSSELQQVLGGAFAPEIERADQGLPVKRLDSRTLLDINMRTGAPDGVFENSFYVWQPDELRDRYEAQAAIRDAVGGYLNSEDYVSGSSAPEIAPDDPVFYEDPSLLEAEAQKQTQGLLQMVFRPTVEAQTGDVRFSVFGYGSFKLERERHDGRIKVLTADDITTRQNKFEDFSSQSNTDSASDVVAYGSVAVANPDDQSNLLWLLESARKNPIESIGALLALMLLIGGMTRWMEGRGTSPMAQAAPRPAPAPPPPPRAERSTPTRRRRRTRGDSRRSA